MAYPETTDHVALVNRYLSAQMSAQHKGLQLETTAKKFRLILGEYLIGEEESIYAVERLLAGVKKIEPRPTGY
jgi:hypothetical protein